MKILDDLVDGMIRGLNDFGNTIKNMCGIDLHPMDGANVIFIDKTLLSSRDLEEFRNNVIQTLGENTVYELDKFRYIHSLRSSMNSNLMNSLYPNNFYEEIDKRHINDIFIIFDPSWVCEDDEGLFDILVKANVDRTRILVHKRMKHCVYCCLEQYAGIYGIDEADENTALVILDSLL